VIKGLRASADIMLVNHIWNIFINHNMLTENVVDMYLMLNKFVLKSPDECERIKNSGSAQNEIDGEQKSMATMPMCTFNYV